MSTAEVIQIDKSFDNWDLPVAAYNILKREGISDIDKLTQLTEEDLLNMRGFLSRPHAREGLIRTLHKQGYRLAGYIDFKEVIMPGLTSGYQVNRDATKVVSPLGRELKPITSGGKVYISTKIDGSYTKTLLATMVLSAFVGYENDVVSEYIDGNHFNCAIDNLKWSSVLAGRAVNRGKARKASSLSTAAEDATGGKVETYRMYVSDDVTASISDDGTGSIKVGSTTVSLTNRQLKSLVLVAGRIGEVNALMGIG